MDTKVKILIGVVFVLSVLVGFVAVKLIFVDQYNQHYKYATMLAAAGVYLWLARDKKDTPPTH